MTAPTLFVFDRRDEIWRFMSEEWNAIASMAIGEKDVFTAALSGGNSPREFYTRLACLPGFPWNKTHLFLVDERFVSFRDRDSNLGMLRETLIKRIPIPGSNIHPVLTDMPTPLIAAAKYEEDIKAFFRLSERTFPSFDFILLGIGEDGHTASLFPMSDALREEDRLVVPVNLNDHRHDRVTLTLPVLNKANHVFFLVTGKHKADVIQRIMEGEDGPLPASMIKPEAGRLVFVMDREAASKLHTHIEGSRTE